MTTQTDLQIDYGHIYIIKLNKKNIYKISKTNEIKIKDHIKQYPNNIKLIYSTDCPMISKILIEINDIFSIKFKKYDKDNEYFIGNIDDMLIDMNIIINTTCGLFNKIKNDMFLNEVNKLENNKNNEIKKINSKSMFKLLDKIDISSNPLEELHEFNIIKEYNNLQNRNNLNKYDQALYYICEVLIDCVEHDKQNGDYSTPINNEKIKQAGNLLHSYDGISVMDDVLNLWIPKRYRNEISLLWDGIGNWRS